MRSLSWGTQDLVPWPGIEPGPPPSLALGAQSLRHWSTREAPEDPNFIDEKNQIRTGESNLLRVSLWERGRYYIQAQTFLAPNQMLTYYLFYQWILTSLVLSLSLFVLLGSGLVVCGISVPWPGTEPLDHQGISPSSLLKLSTAWELQTNIKFQLFICGYGSTFPRIKISLLFYVDSQFMPITSDSPMV